MDPRKTEDTQAEDTQTRHVVCRLLESGVAQREVAKQLGVSRETMLAIAIGARVSRGSMALVRERIRGLIEAELVK